MANFTAKRGAKQHSYVLGLLCLISHEVELEAIDLSVTKLYVQSVG